MDAQQSNQVVVTDIKMPFLSMVLFMVKWAIAAIPAIIILAILGVLLAGVLGGMAGSAFNATQSVAEPTAPTTVASVETLYAGYIAAQSAGHQSTAENYAALIRQHYPDSAQRSEIDSRD